MRSSVGESSVPPRECPWGRSKYEETEGAKRKRGTLHASCATGNLNNWPSDPITLLLFKIQHIEVKSVDAQATSSDVLLFGCVGTKSTSENQHA